MVDVLTGGRLVAGMLRGTATEYVTYGTNPAESRERFEEALQLILRAWTEPQPFGWLGRFYEYRTVAIWPRPIQQPHPPIFMSGSSPESGELAARHRLHLGLAFTTVPLAREAARYFREQAAVAGWEPTPDHLLYRLPVHVADTDEQAIEDLRVSGAAAGPASYTASNRAVGEAVASAGYYGRDAATQRGRAGPRPEGARRARAIAGGRSRDGPGADSGHQRRARRGHPRPELPARLPRQDPRSIELFGTKVLPRMREL